MAYVDWHIKGPEYTNCNCAWGCPCQFNALPTKGFCAAMAAMRIEEGHFGGTRLDGLAWVATFRWPGPVHEGNGTQQMIIDARADAAQRDALVAILHGKETVPGATHFQVFNSMVTEVVDPIFAPIDVAIDVDACKARVAVPNLVESVGAPMRNPFSGEDHRVRVSLRKSFEYTEAEFGSGSTTTKGAIKLDFTDSYGQFANIHLTQNGVLR